MGSFCMTSLKRNSPYLRDTTINEKLSRTQW
jgi:hypothetical protein